MSPSLDLEVILETRTLLCSLPASHFSLFLACKIILKTKKIQVGQEARKWFIQLVACIWAGSYWFASPVKHC